MRATCAWCGDIVVATTDVQCAIDHGGERALLSFACPGCTRSVLVNTSAPRAAARLLGGAQLVTGTLPLELLEVHTGPPLTWDDLLDLHLEIELLNGVHGRAA